MRKLSLATFLIATAPVFAQLPSQTLTVSATRNINLQPDQVVFNLAVTSSLSTNLDQIVGALSGVGITSSDLTGVGNNSNPPTLQWNFTLAVPIGNLTANISSLVKLQQTITQNNSGLNLTFLVDGTQVSQQLWQSQSCSNADLISDATVQAQKVAAAAGVTLGPIIHLSNAPMAAASSGEVAVRNVYLTDFLLGVPPSPVTCSLVVQFQLLP